MDEMTALFSHLKELTAIPSTSGFEQGIVKRIYSEMSSFADRVEVDGFGNTYAYLIGKSEAFRPRISQLYFLNISPSLTCPGPKRSNKPL